MSLLISTYTHPDNTTLLGMWKELLPKNTPVSVTEGTVPYTTYLPELLLHDEDWVLHMDDDCFLLSFRQVESLMEHMKEKNIGVCGIPDGSTVPVRWQNRASLASCFLLFNTTYIRRAFTEKFKKSWDSIRKDIATVLWSPWNDKLLDYIPQKLQHFGNGKILPIAEPWYPFMHFMILNFGHLHLDAICSGLGGDDNAAIIVNHNRRAMAVHTWYARQYGRPENKRRINANWELAVKYSELDRENLELHFKDEADAERNWV